MISIEDFLTSFQKELSSKVNGTQKWWIKSLFHFSDITNALSIIENGAIYSRDKAIELDLMQNDNANDNVIALTNNKHKQYARLYFGPLTPTQKNNEGIKPINKIVNNAHCPIPIMFIFNFKKVFMLEDVEFTDGNLATNPTIYKNVNGLEKLDFSLIYHRSWFYPEDRDKIINARHSEVLLKDKLHLEDNLRLIAVRSEAEKETLLYQLSEDMQEKYQNKIYVQPQTGIFINDWLYIEKVSLIDNKIHINWHKCANSSKCQDNYTLKIVAKTVDNIITKTLQKSFWYPKDSLQKINLPAELIEKIFELTIYIDDIKAYSNLLGVNK